MQHNLDTTLYLLRRQLANGVFAFSPCANRCGDSARGGMECAKCLQGHLGTLIGTDKAREAVEAIMTGYQVAEVSA